MSSVTVKLTALSSSAISEATHGAGVRLNYGAVTQVRVNNAVLPVIHPDIERRMLPGATPAEHAMCVSSTAANGLVAFVQRYLSGKEGCGNYNGLSLLIAMTTRLPFNHRPRGAWFSHYNFEGFRVSATQVRPGVGYFVTGEDGVPLHAFVGRGNNMSLAVNGSNASLAISPVETRMRAYGGTRLFKVTRVTPNG